MVNPTKRSAPLDWLLAIALFGLAFWLRADNLDHFVTADEHNWVYRSGIFLHAFLQKDWPGTSVWYTPAVTTTWLGSAGLAVYYNLYQATINQPLSEWLISFSRNKVDLDILAALRGSMALFTALMVAVVYDLARKLWPRPLALLGTLLLLTEPHLLAVSRIIGHDALITFFVVASLLAFLCGKSQIKTPLVNSVLESKTIVLDSSLQPGWFVLSGVLAGLAILSKTPALILIPFIGLIGLVDLWQHKIPISRWGWAWLTWGVALVVAFVLVWPAAWVDPLGQSWFVIGAAFFSSAGLEDADIQPYWSIPDPGIFYYPLNGIFKMSPFLLLGVVLAGVGAWLKHKRNEISWANLLTADLAWLGWFALLFGLMLTFGEKKSPRYILPAFPALAFVAAWGWLFMLRRVNQWLVIGAVGTLALLLTLNYAPYYFTYYNPLLGGAVTAPRLVRIGWGEGLDEVGRWLNTQPEAIAGQAGARYTATLHPFYAGTIASPIAEGLDYVVFYIKQTQSGYPEPEILAYFAAQQPLHRVTLNGIEYAQIYQGPAMQPVKKRAGVNLPIAFRPHTIYAPIGNQFTVDLLWPNASFEARLTEGSDTPYRNDNESENQESKTIVFDSKTLFSGQPIILTLQTADGQPVLEAQAAITELAPGVRVSRHNFDISVDMARAEYILSLEGKQPLGNIKARLMDIPADYKLLSVVMAGQLKLAGLRRRVEDGQLRLDLAWQAWPAASNDYTVFVQLLDEKGQRIAGLDISPEPGFTTLERKEVMLTHYDLPLPENRPPGKYSLLVGLYYFAGNELINVGAAVLEPPVVIN
jgi:4-amino-4-deoxy-L-arabinose transferase-like glycosyltransferase